MLFPLGVVDFGQTLIEHIGVLAFAAVCFFGVWSVFNYIANHLLYNWKFPGMSRTDIENLDNMSVKDFEILLENLFRNKGYTVVKPQTAGISDKHFVVVKDGVRTAVRFYKFPTRRRVTQNAVYHVLTGKVFHKCQNTLLVTTTRFTAEAESEARLYGVEMWDRGRFLAEVAAYYLAVKAMDTKLARF